MRRLSFILMFMTILAVGGGSAFLVTWDVAPPTKLLEKVLPDDQFPR